METRLKSGNFQLQSCLQAKEESVCVCVGGGTPHSTIANQFQLGTSGSPPTFPSGGAEVCAALWVLEQTEDLAMASQQLCFRLLGLLFLLFALQGELTSFFPSFVFMISVHLRPVWTSIFVLEG